MKAINFTFILLLVLSFISCNSRKESGNEVIYEYEEEISELSPELKAKLGEWPEVGVICYGCVVALDFNRNPLVGKSVKSKIIRIKGDSIKMKALENISVGDNIKEGCTKLGISKGETWWETEGDLFQTKDEADNYLRSKGLLE